MTPESSHFPPAQGAVVNVEWHHVSLAVDDLDRAMAFFRAAFGFDVLFIERAMDAQIASITGSPGMICDLVQMRQPGQSHVIELITFSPVAGALAGDAQPIRPGCGHIAFKVADLDGARRTIEALGAVVIGEVTRFDTENALYCRTPGGAFLELGEELGS